MRTKTLAFALALVLPACAGNEPAPAAPSATATTASVPAGSAPATPATPAAPEAAATPAPAATPGATVSPAIQAAVDAPDRDADDRALDKGRRPAEVLAFFGIAPGQKVGELVAGLGYTTGFLARVVGPSGVVYAENPRFFLEKFAEKPWSARLQKPAMKNVKRVDREIDAPMPPDVKDLDAVIFILTYHDTVWLKADRDKMNKAVFAALKPGGVYGIVDHAGRAGTGVSEVQTVHRIDEKAVIDEVTKAGFKLAGEADFLRNPKDTRDWNASPMAAGERRGTTDRFVLKFTKP